MLAETNKFLADFDFSLLNDSDFKEDSVREELVKPLLNALGYHAKGKNKIIRSKGVEHPFVKVGTKKRPITNFPDYLLQAEGKNAWVLDAKSPNEEIKTGEHVEQAYFYAIHPEIRVPIFALCNGREFIAFETNNDKPIIYFRLSELEKHWEKLQSLLAPEAVTPNTAKKEKSVAKEREFNYRDIIPPSQIREIQKQSAARHFGVHGYFTKQPFKVVQAYLERFTQPNDLILDPFGGSGVTVIEALILGRNGIHIDINPLSVFITKSLVAPVDIGELLDAFKEIQREFLENCPRTKKEVEKALKQYSYPKDISLMRNADVRSIEELFTLSQLAQLSYLKHLILKIKDRNVSDSLLLAFSSTLTKINRTYHPSTSRGDNAGDSAAFRYYRFRIAPEPVELDVMNTFVTKVKKLIAAKKEIAPLINYETVGNAQIYKGTATDLNRIEDESVDYIYTDPPYGAKIPYLDLSIMWNAWLDLPITKEDYQLEAIEGGEQNKTKKEYSDLIAQSIKEMYRVLKFDRWMSFVFNHKDPAYWHIIVNTAESMGFEYAGAVEQASGQASFKKRQNPFTVLRGQLIINFKKVKNPNAIAKYELGTDITNIILQTVEGIIAREHGATIDQINSEVMIRGMEMGFLDILSSKFQDLSPFLGGNFDYDQETEKYHIRKNTKFRTSIPIELRVRYYTYSYLKRMSFQKQDPTFDEIVLNIMPLLKNGVTPENQTILNVLEDIAYRVGEDRWRLKSTGQANLFDNALT
ncbi:MAG TPA: DNA methyltransferase [Pyrinomonadaceae bacterium]|jgi:DNA modification methylase|nr:DNA methyltransferase [Pyrinomonadaceae bacterium]